MKGVLHDISFDLHRGEILGVAGLGGSGRSELLESLYGLHRASAGKITVDGVPVAIRRPADAVRAGLSLLPEDRQGAGLVVAHDGDLYLPALYIFLNKDLVVVFSRLVDGGDELVSVPDLGGAHGGAGVRRFYEHGV